MAGHWIAIRAEVGKGLLVRHRASIQPEENKDPARRIKLYKMVVRSLSVCSTVHNFSLGS